MIIKIIKREKAKKPQKVSGERVKQVNFCLDVKPYLSLFFMRLSNINMFVDVICLICWNKTTFTKTAFTKTADKYYIYI